MPRPPLTEGQKQKLEKLQVTIKKRLDEYFARRRGEDGEPMSDREFEKVSGFSFSQASKMRKGKLNLGLDSLVKLADALGMPVSCLIEERVNLEGFRTDEETRGLVEEFLETALGTNQFQHAVRKMIDVLRSNSEASAAQASLRDEMDIMDTFWAIIEAYLRSDWRGMLENAQELESLGGGFCRPSLMWLARTYEAYAYRNMPGGGNLKKASDAIGTIPEREWGAVQHRIRAQVQSRLKKLEEALQAISKAEAALKQCDKPKPLALWERVKVLRRKAHIYTEMARTAEDEPQRDELLQKAGKYLETATNAWTQLRQSSPALGRSEESALRFYQAMYHAVRGDHEETEKLAMDSFQSLLSMGTPWELAYRQARPLILAAEEQLRRGDTESAIYCLAIILAGRAHRHTGIKELFGERLRRLTREFQKRIDRMLQ
jgi:transcriptional regulator with XRE-family HTH domain